jgi:hypothetical protein
MGGVHTRTQILLPVGKFITFLSNAYKAKWICLIFRKI